jgi:pyridoxal/pyridoxine/pyridoxamine kinase
VGVAGVAGANAATPIMQQCGMREWMDEAMAKPAAANL